MTADATAATITVLIAEDEPDARLLLEMQLELEPDLRIVGSVGDGKAAVDFCRSQDGAVDVVVTDLLMPRVTGIDAIGVLRDEFPEIGIVAYTAVAGPVVRGLPERYGIEVVLKSGDTRDLVGAIRRAADPTPDPPPDEES